jgi:hypothetical protein
MNPKIADHNLMRKACIYIRQSTMAQVRFNQESTERQYNLADQAKSLGWMQEQIRILVGEPAAPKTHRALQAISTPYPAMAPHISHCKRSVYVYCLKFHCAPKGPQRTSCELSRPELVLVSALVDKSLIAGKKKATRRVP